MEQLVRVQRINADGTAQVLHLRQSACSGDCHKCSGCGAVQQKMLLTAQNPIGAKPGQAVIVRSETAPVLAAAAVLYMLPLVLFVAGYLLGLSRWGSGGLAGFAGFLLGLAAAVAYDRLVMRKKNTVYTIIGFAPEGTSLDKGDNNLD
jgi:sigma-E factor negative regulatory protein RseC